MNRRISISISVSAMIALLCTAQNARSADAPAAPAAAPADPVTDSGKTCSVEEGQRLRAAGKLKDAGSFFLTCREQCAPKLHPECERAAQDVLASMPTIIVKAKDPRGNTITDDVTVLIDGKVVASELDGKAFAVDPGPHTVVVQKKERITQEIVAKEGVKGQLVEVMFRSVRDPDGAARDIGGHTIWPWAVVAVGVVGVVSGIAIVLTAPSLPEGCNKETKVCEPGPGERTTSSSFTQRRDQAGAAADQPKVGGVMIGLGVAVAAGGLIWHFIEPTEPRVGKKNRPLFAPWVAHQGGGLAASGSF